MINYSKKLISYCTKHNLSISIAESCTGGMIASKLISTPGASKVIDCGLITYSNLSKTLYLDVSHNTLQKYGAVSSQVAELMVNGLKNKLKSDFFLATTGVAGPMGGSDRKPVGTVYHSFLFEKNKKVITLKKKYNGSRFKIRMEATLFAIKKSYLIIESSI